MQRGRQHEPQTWPPVHDARDHRGEARLVRERVLPRIVDECTRLAEDGVPRHTHVPALGDVVSQREERRREAQRQEQQSQPPLARSAPLGADDLSGTWASYVPGKNPTGVHQI